MTYQETKQYIMEMYPGRMYIGKKEVCQLLSTSLPTLDRRLAAGDNLAQIVKKQRRKVLFPIPDLARVLSSEE